jgi:ABC-type lipoprotein release transport system permease subunit
MKYGLKTILRTPVKTVLFILLIAMVSGFLALGAGMYRSSERMLEEADAVFKTAGEFVFMSGNYPDVDKADKALEEAKAAFKFEDYITKDILMFEQSATLRGYIDGSRPPVTDMPYQRYGMFTLTLTAKDESGARGRISAIHYYESDEALEGLGVEILSDSAQYFEVGEQYVVFGELTGVVGLRDLYFNLRSFKDDLHIPDSFGICEPFYNVTGCDIDEFWQSSAGEYFQTVMETLSVRNNSFNITISYDITAVSSFHKNEIVLESGEIPTDNAIPSCLVPLRLALQQDIKPGDMLTVNIHKPSVGSGVYASYLQQEGFVAQEAFKVSGIYRSEQTDAPIYMLDCGQEWIAASDVDYTLARTVIKNREAASYLEYVRSKLPIGVTFEPYDQGYEAATRSIFNMRETALLVVVVSGLVGCVVLWFFAFLFVFRAAESVRIILRLGAGAGKALVFLLTGSSVTALIASAVGSFAGYLLSGQVVTAVYEASEMNRVYDLRFSILSRSANLESFNPTPQIRLDIYIAVFAGIVMVAMVLCLIFGIITIRTQNAHARFKKAVRRSATHERLEVKRFIGNYDIIPTVPLRYAIRSIFRGRFRSMVVPVLFTVMLIFIFLFNQMRESYRMELNNVYENIPVSLWFTNSRALRSDMGITGESFDELEVSGYVRDKWHYKEYRYMDLGLVRRADGTQPSIPPGTYEIPRGDFSYETFTYQLNSMTSPFQVSYRYDLIPEFVQAGTDAVTWAEGASQEQFESFVFDWEAWSIAIQEERVPEPQLVPGLFSWNYLREKGYNLGDTIRLSQFYLDPGNSTWSNLDHDILVAGGYEVNVDRDAVYVPVSMNIDSHFRLLNRVPNYYTYDNEILMEEATVLNAFSNDGGFTIGNPAQLTAFKDWLESRYDPVGKIVNNRRWLIIDDKALYSTIESLTRYIGYMDMLFPVMMAAVAAIGFIASSLLLKSRGSEISALRSLGARVRQVFLSFFIEPII